MASTRSIASPTPVQRLALTTEYRPVWRRPIADVFRATAHRTVRFCVGRGIHADTISYLSIVASALAALSFGKSSTFVWTLIIAPLFCYARLWLNMLDGMVAIASGEASPRGEIVNDLPDRVSDVLIFGSLAHSGLASPALAYWAAIGALLTAYVGTLGQAVGVQREFSGAMAKPWRMAVLHVGAWCAAVAALAGWPPRFGGLTLLDWTCLVVIIGCAQTIGVRLRRILKALETRAMGGVR